MRFLRLLWSAVTRTWMPAALAILSCAVGAVILPAVGNLQLCVIVLFAVAGVASGLELRTQLPWQNVAVIAGILAGAPVALCALLMGLGADPAARLFCFANQPGWALLPLVGFGLVWFAVAASSRMAAKSLLSFRDHSPTYGYEVLAMTGVLAFAMFFGLELLPGVSRGANRAATEAAVLGIARATLCLVLLATLTPWLIRKRPGAVQTTGKAWTWLMVSGVMYGGLLARALK